MSSDKVLMNAWPFFDEEQVAAVADVLRSGKVKGMRFDTLARLCAALECKPADLLDYDFDPADLEPRGEDGDA